MSNEETAASEEIVSEGSEVAGGHYIHFSNEALRWSEEPDDRCMIVVTVGGPLGLRHFRTELTRERPTGTPYQPRFQNKDYTVEFYFRDAYKDARCPFGEDSGLPNATSKPFSVAGGDKLVTLFKGPEGWYAEVSNY